MSVKKDIFALQERVCALRTAVNEDRVRYSTTVGRLVSNIESEMTYLGLENGEIKEKLDLLAAELGGKFFYKRHEHSRWVFDKPTKKEKK